MIVILEAIAAVANYICIVLFVLQNAVIKVIDFVLDHNKDLEEKLYRRSFDRLERYCDEQQFMQNQKDFEAFQNEFNAEYNEFMKGV